MADVATIDDIFRLLGDPGRYEIIIYLCMCLNYFPVSFNHLIMGFYGHIPSHHCKVPANMSVNDIIPLSIGSDENEKLDECSIYKVINGTVFKNVTLSCSDVEGWDYDLEENERTIATEWNLVCNKKFMGSLATSIYFSGVMIGGLLFGFLSDKYGRKPTMLFTLYAQFVFGIILFFVQHYEAFVALRFFQGVLFQGLQGASYVIVSELFTPQRRTAFGTLTEVFWSIAVMWLSLMAFLIKDWRYIQLALTLPTVITIVFIWIVPESLRWLITHHKYSQAQELLKRFSRVNNVKLPNSLINDISSLPLSTTTRAATKNKNYGILDTVRTPKLRKLTLIQSYIWWTCAVLYYGLSLNVTSLAGNKYLNFFISGLVELPAFTCAFIILQRFGRKKPLSFYFFIGGITCIAAGTIPKQTSGGTDISLLTTVLALIGKFSSAGCFSIVFLYASELFPTVIRTIGIGVCTFWTRLGGVLAPQILLLGAYTFTSLPIIGFGILALVGGFLTLLLPETLDKTTPDTIEQIEASDQFQNEKSSKGEENQAQLLAVSNVTDKSAKDNQEDSAI